MAKKNRMDERSSYAFVGFLILGIAFGMLLNQVAVGTLIGLALGFISIALLGKGK
jgi:hypothetical protein